MHFCDLICVIIINEKKSIKVYYEHKRIKIGQKTRKPKEIEFIYLPATLRKRVLMEESFYTI